LVTGKWEISINVDATQLLFGDKYRFMAIVYTNVEDTYEVNSFISPEEYVVDQLPTWDGTGIDFSGFVNDIDDNYLGNDLECVVEERIRANVKMEFPADQYKDYIQAALGLTIGNDVRRYMTNVIMEIYEETVVGPNTYRRVMHYANAIKTGPTTYSAVSGLTLDFSVPDEATFKYDFRVGYESWLPNLYTYVNGVALLTPDSDQNWAGRNMKVEWKFVFLYDDYSTPFQDTLIYQHRIRPNGYEGDRLALEFQDPDQALNDFVCTDDGCCMQGHLLIADTGYNLITNVEVAPGNKAVLEEAEAWVPDRLAQLTTPKVISQETSYGQSTAAMGKFCLDLTTFSVNLNYKISVLAKPKSGIAGRILSDGTDRDTNDGTQRQIS
jgi:hypothetical protein